MRTSITTTAMRMIEAAAGPVAEDEAERTLAMLLAWFSPALPVGAFSYSHGLETMVEDGAIHDRAGAFAAIEAALVHGAGRSDAVLLAHAYRAAAAGDTARFGEIRALALALSPSRERHEEAVRQGNAFVEITGAVWPGQNLVGEDDAVPFPIAVAAAGAAHGIALGALSQAFVTAFAANLVSAAVRLVPLGQTDGQRLTRDLAPVAAEVARTARAAPLDDVGGFVLGLDLASMRHECQEVRLFRS